MEKDKCDRNCATCAHENRSFCAVQMAMANQEILLAMAKQIDEMKAFQQAQQAEKKLINPSLNITEPTAPGTEEE